jgi:hypothetical protein
MTERVLRGTSLVFLFAVLVHGADHTRRGIGSVSLVVLTAGTVQTVFAVAAVVMVFRRHPMAATFSMGVGFISAAGFVAAHLVPHWSALSDSFVGSDVGAGVNASSWFTALFEIAADVAFGAAGLAALRGRDRASSPSSSDRAHVTV